MEETKLYNNLNYYLFYALALAILLAAVLSYNTYILLISSLVLLAAAITMHSGSLINNALIKKSKIIEIKNGYKLSRNLISATRRSGRCYNSIAVAILKPRNGFSYNGQSMKDFLETAREPFEFSISLKEVDKSRILESLESGRRMKEISLSRLKSTSYDKINALRRQIEIADTEISNIKNGGKSFEASMLLSALSSSENEYEAELEASKNIELLSNKLSASIGVDYKIIKGESLLDFI